MTLDDLMALMASHKVHSCEKTVLLRFMPLSLEESRPGKKKSPPSYDRVEIDCKGNTVQGLQANDLTVNNKTLKRTEVELGSQILMVAEGRVLTIDKINVLLLTQEQFTLKHKVWPYCTRRKKGEAILGSQGSSRQTAFVVSLPRFVSFALLLHSSAVRLLAIVSHFVIL